MGLLNTPRAKMETGENLRPKRLKEPYQPLFYETIRSEKSKEVEMKTVIKDMVQYFIYLAIIMVISYGTRDAIQCCREIHLRNLIFHNTGLDFKALFMVERFSANFAENEADSVRPWGSRGKFTTVQSF